MRNVVALAVLTASAPASAEVVSSNGTGFHLRHTVTLPVQPGVAFAAFTKVDRWWDPDHTYGGNAAGLSLQATPGGCFCERLPNGGIEHMRVTYVDRGKRIVMTGGLGPLLYEATAGSMDVKFDATAAGSTVTINYKVAGFAAGGADKLAPPVDKVLAGQWARYATFAVKP